jgi:hypothetical protein
VLLKAMKNVKEEIIMNELKAMQSVNPLTVSADELVDINDVKVSKDLPKQERIAEFIKQIKNPYCFKCGNFIVKARYTDNGLSMEDCLQSIML